MSNHYLEERGAPEGIRTPNLLIRSQMLYPLSYGRMSTAGQPENYISGGRARRPRLGTTKLPAQGLGIDIDIQNQPQLVMPRSRRG